MNLIRKFSVVIPTLNRKKELLKAIDSILHQSLLPFEIIIVDQSTDDSAYMLIKDLLQKNNSSLNLIYIHRRNLKGLVHAKKIGLEASNTDYICYLEDDIILTPSFLDNITIPFNDINLNGCSGIILNHPRPSFFGRIIFYIFHIGIFRDDRFNIYNDLSSEKLIISDKLSGGLTMWKKSVFSYVNFDNDNFFHYYEDIEFSTRVNNVFPNTLKINTSAKLYHYPSKYNRSSHEEQYKNKILESIRYFKKRRSWNYSHISILVLLCGYFIASICKLNIKYVIIFFKAIFYGFYNRIEITK